MTSYGDSGDVTEDMWQLSVTSSDLGLGTGHRGSTGQRCYDVVGRNAGLVVPSRPTDSKNHSKVWYDLCEQPRDGTIPKQ